MNAARRAVVLSIPPPVASRVDAIRRRWDPLMTARIGPHVTLVRDVGDHGHAERLVAAAAADCGPFEVALTATRTWSSARYGIFLDVEDPSGSIARLRGRLVEVELRAAARGVYRPHVTLVHGRTVAPEAVEPAWAALRDLRVDWTVVLDAIDVLELAEPIGWRRVERVPLTASAAVD